MKFLYIMSLVIMFSISSAANEEGKNILWLCQNLVSVDPSTTFDSFINKTESKDEKTLILLLKHITNCMLMTEQQARCEFLDPKKYAPFEKSVPLILKVGENPNFAVGQILKCNVDYLINKDKKSYEKCLRIQADEINKIDKTKNSNLVFMLRI